MDIVGGLQTSAPRIAKRKTLLSPSKSQQRFPKQDIEQ
jgi:hypothetical protein